MGPATAARDAGPALQGAFCLSTRQDKKSVKTDSPLSQTGRSCRLASEDLFGSPFLKSPPSAADRFRL